ELSDVLGNRAVQRASRRIAGNLPDELAGAGQRVVKTAVAIGPGHVLDLGDEVVVRLVRRARQRPDDDREQRDERQYRTRHRSCEPKGVGPTRGSAPKRVSRKLRTLRWDGSRRRDVCSAGTPP